MAEAVVAAVAAAAALAYWSTPAISAVAVMMRVRQLQLTPTGMCTLQENHRPRTFPDRRHFNGGAPRCLCGES